jgi:4-amino-4-deoxy-L-arabinose transferase-like glycosyltransferase
VGARLAWAFIFPVPPRGDGFVYYLLLQMLAEHGVYLDLRGDRAIWPPGYPLFLYSLSTVFGVRPTLPLLGNILLYLVSALLLHRLARQTAGTVAATFTSLVFALWPNHIACSGLVSKEMLVSALIVATVFCYNLSTRDKTDRPQRSLGIKTQHLGWLVLTGIAVGLGSLTQPSVLLFPVVILISDIARSGRIWLPIARSTIVAAAVLLTILPWILRNHDVLGEWVPISTSGGDTFYRANNPLATGGYIRAGEHDLYALPELERSRQGYDLGKAWIREHPLDFLSLMFRKQVIFLSNDSTGVIQTLREGLHITDMRFTLLSGMSNLYWFAIWVLLLLLAVRRHVLPSFSAPATLFAITACLYFLAIDSVFEAGGRHHIPLIGLLSMLVGLLATSEAGQARTEN